MFLSITGYFADGLLFVGLLMGCFIFLGAVEQFFVDFLRKFF